MRSAFSQPDFRVGILAVAWLIRTVGVPASAGLVRFFVGVPALAGLFRILA
jgi:hypothetical protein